MCVSEILDVLVYFPPQKKKAFPLYIDTLQLPSSQFFTRYLTEYKIYIKKKHFWIYNKYDIYVNINISLMKIKGIAFFLKQTKKKYDKT